MPPRAVPGLRTPYVCTIHGMQTQTAVQGGSLWWSDFHSILSMTKQVSPGHWARPHSVGRVAFMGSSILRPPSGSERHIACGIGGMPCMEVRHCVIINRHATKCLLTLLPCFPGSFVPRFSFLIPRASCLMPHASFLSPFRIRPHVKHRDLKQWFPSP